MVAAVAPGGPSWVGLGPQRASARAISAGSVANGERVRRRLGSTPVPDAAGTGRSGREASPGGQADPNVLVQR